MFDTTIFFCIAAHPICAQGQDDDDLHVVILSPGFKQTLLTSNLKKELEFGNKMKRGNIVKEGKVVASVQWHLLGHIIVPVKAGNDILFHCNGSEKQAWFIENVKLKVIIVTKDS